MARPREAMISALRRLPDFQRLNRAALAGHARIFIHPAYARLVNSEPIVKRLIPILIVLFVVAIGAMRVIALYQERADIESSAALRLSLMAKAITGDLAEAALPVSLAQPSEALQGQLENALPPSATAAGRVILVMDPEGRIVAMAPRDSVSTPRMPAFK